MNSQIILSRLRYCLAWLMAGIVGILPMTVNASIQHICNFSEIIRIDTIDSPSGQKFLKFSGDNVWGSGETAHPEIPFAVVRFLVPDNAVGFSVKITGTDDVKTHSVDLPLYPVQQAVPINEYTSDMFTEPDFNAYRNHESSFDAKIIEDSWLEGQYHIVSVAVSPVAYSALSNSFDICGSMAINLQYEEKSAPAKKRSSNAVRGFVDIANLVVNADAAEKVREKSIPSVDDEEIEPDRYYIISERALLPALEELAAWKTQKGYIVTLKAIEDIYEDSRYKVNPSAGIVDEAASLRKYLQDEATEYCPFFCLLVGDHHTKMPIRKVCDYPTSDPNSDFYIPTDNYFVDLSKDNWNLTWNENGLYVCDINKTKFSPYIYVGRLLCHSQEQISNYISKLILYEANPGRGKSEYLNQASVTVQLDGLYCYNYIIERMESTFPMVDSLLDCMILDKSAYGSPTSQEMLATINRSGYCSLIGHGEPSTIACSGKLKESHRWEFVKALNSYRYDEDSNKVQTLIKNECKNNGLDLLTNFDYPSIIYTEACTTCPFDIYNSGNMTFDITHTMASSYTVGGLYGGVAYLGNTRKGYTGYSANLEFIFLNSIQNNPKIGIAEALSKYQYTGDERVRHAHNLIGDPEMEIWLGRPDKLNVTPIWQNGYISIGGNDQLGSRVILNDGMGGIKAFDFKREISHNLPYINSNDRMVAIGVYKTGFLPIVSLNCDNQSLTDCVKRFVVRDAHLGLASTSVNIGKGADVAIKTVDNAECGRSLIVSDGGTLSIKSDKSVSISGSSVSSGGKMTICCEDISISNGFSVELGSRFSINKGE